MYMGFNHWFGAGRNVRSDTKRDVVSVREWKSVAHDLRICADSGLCADCGQETKWACDWDLMRKAADVIEAMAKEMGLE